MGRSLGLVALCTFALVLPVTAQTPAPRPAPKKAPAARRPIPPPPPVVEPAPPAPVPPPSTDVKVVTAYTQGAQVSQNTTYIRGPRQRVEFPGMVSLDQCDLQRTVMLSPAAKRYRVQAYGQPVAAAPAPDPATAPPAVGGMADASRHGRPAGARRRGHGDDDADRHARTPADVRPRGAPHQDGRRAPAVGRRLRQGDHARRDRRLVRGSAQVGRRLRARPRRHRPPRPHRPPTNARIASTRGSPAT